ncbi:ubiquinone/menaquinone biosynthesis C-methylase UbiE [Tamilnaduibacter salinus]|uniref:Ubiquinone/menaquinone biosynthesis C-methylase UbiE n=1 Tax=Tamilnaduibacter salinus TaxID=1484056 RepID=A0A2U1CYW0_9GAMM|nr:class I SAM-dependent methyltransferase [Tamilnaduibacter salinus]PVY77976.1 ubiquinone/menaquinone biosynthesis C-methylase UbiE [Tamilnaduibacter salinus]
MTTAQDTAQHSLRPHNQGPSAVWSSGGAAYDEVSRGILDAIEHAINRLEPSQPMRILDLATGTGWTARRLAERGYDVTGADFAPDMLSAARDLAGARQLPIPFVDGDAEALPFDDGEFDALISTFGVMFTQRPEDAAAEMARVVRPGGRLVLAVWTPDGKVFEMFKVIKQYMPTPEGEPPPSPFAWGDTDRLKVLLGDAFELAFERGTSYYREPDALAAWRTFVEGYGPVQTLAGKLDAKRRDQFESDFVAFHEQFEDELGVTVPRDYLIVRGIRR